MPLDALTRPPALLTESDVELGQRAEGREYTPIETITHLGLAIEYRMNAHELIRAEVVFPRSNPVVKLSRWKITADNKAHRTAQSFELGAHRTDAIVMLIIEAQRLLAASIPVPGADDRND
jgi:hypothetical protein